MRERKRDRNKVGLGDRRSTFKLLVSGGGDESADRFKARVIESYCLIDLIILERRSKGGPVFP